MHVGSLGHHEPCHAPLPVPWHLTDTARVAYHINNY